MPVIFCSASYHEREVREMARSLGVRNTLLKPYDVAFGAPDRRRGAGLGTGEQSAEAWRPPRAVEGGAQERLSALVAFSRRLFGQTRSGHDRELHVPCRRATSCWRNVRNS